MAIQKLSDTSAKVKRPRGTVVEAEPVRVKRSKVAGAPLTQADEKRARRAARLAAEAAAAEPVRVKRPKVQVESRDDDDEAMPLDLTKAERKALGLVRGEELFKLNSAQRRILKALSSESSEKAPRQPKAALAEGLTEKEMIRDLKAQVRELEKQIRYSDRKATQASNLLAKAVAALEA